MRILNTILPFFQDPNLLLVIFVRDHFFQWPFVPVPWQILTNHICWWPCLPVTIFASDLCCQRSGHFCQLPVCNFVSDHFCKGSLWLLVIFESGDFFACRVLSSPAVLSNLTFWHFYFWMTSKTSISYRIKLTTYFKKSYFEVTLVIHSRSQWDEQKRCSIQDQTIEQLNQDYGHLFLSKAIIHNSSKQWPIYPTFLQNLRPISGLRKSLQHISTTF